jgi:hypothetical protein
MQRRRFLTLTVASLLATPFALAAPHTKGSPVAPLTPEIAPGDYVWRPEISPAGPVVLIVSLPEQVMYVYRNGVRIGRSTVSTGKAGKRTPTGVFTVLQRKVDHTSTIYKGAEMPHMQRLTWSGIAMHAGNLPGYPASAGCVRLPVDFAAQLYSVTSLGTTVIITDQRSAPGSTNSPGLLFAATPGEVAPAGRQLWQPEKAPKGPVSVIVSSADGAVYVYRNGVEIGRAPVGGLRHLSGSHVYSATASVDAAGRRDWLATASVGGRAPNIKTLVQQASVDQQFLAGVRALITSGTTLVLTDAPVSVSTRSGSGFNILTTEAAP